MAKYTLERNDGTVYELEGPEGASKEDLVRVLEQKMRPQQPSGGVGPAQSLRELYASRDAAIEPREFSRTLPGQVGELFRGIPRGAVGLLETAGIGASALLPEEAEQAVRGGIERVADVASSPFQPKAGYEDALLGKLGEGLGSTGPFLAAGLLRSLLLRGATGLGLGTATGAGEARTRAEEAGATDEERATATALGTLPGALEMFPPAAIINRFRKAVGPDNATAIVDRLRRVATSAGEEGLQEAASNIAQNLIAQGVYDPEQGTFTNTGESFGLGAGVGGLIAGLVELGIRDRGRATTDPVKDVLEGGEEELAPGEIAPAVAEAAAPSQAPAAPTGTELTLDDILSEGVQARAAQDADTFYPRSDLDREANRARGNIRELEDDLISDLTRVAPTPAEAPATLEPALDVELDERVQQRARQDQEQAQRGQEAQLQQDAARRQSILDIENELIAAVTPTEAPAAPVVTPTETVTRPPRADIKTSVQNVAKELNLALPPNQLTSIVNRAMGQPDVNREAFIREEVGKLAPKSATPAVTPAAVTPALAAERTVVPEVESDAFISEFSGIGTYTAKLNGRIADAKRELAQAEEVPQGIRASLGVEVGPLQAEVDRLEALRPVAQRVDDANQKRDTNKAMLSGVRQELDVSNLSQSEKLAAVEAARNAASTGEASRIILDAVDAKEGAPKTIGTTTPNAEQEFRANVTRLITNANQAKLAEAYQTVVGEAPPADVKTAVKKFSLPEQVAIYNEYNAVQGRSNSELVLPGRFSVQPKREEAAAIPANARLMDSVRRGDSSGTILQGIAQDKDVPQPLRNLARSMLRVAPNITIPVIEQRYKEPDVVGAYVHPQQGDEAIYLDPRSESAAQTFLHEFVHPMTVNAIARKTPEGQRVVQLFEQYKAQHPESSAYGFTNPYEFVAEGITNPKFQSTLKRQNWWGRFVDAIRRIIGLPASQSGTVEELIDLTKRMGAAESATRVQQSAEDVVFDDTPTNNTKFLRLQGEELNSTSKPMRSKPVRDAVAKVMGTESGSATAKAGRTVLTWGLPLPALNDYVQSYMSKGDYKPFADAMKRFTETAVKFEGAMREFVDGITAQITRMGEWKKANADKYEAFTNLYFGASHARVDLTKPESDYANNPEKLSAYRRLMKDFVAIGPSGQAIYRQMRAIHNRQFKQISQQVFDRVYSDTKDKGMATRVRDAFVAQMREKGPLEGYAPMLRPSGKHMLKYVIKGEDAFEIFTNPNDQKAREQQLLAEGVRREDIKPFLGDNLREFDGVVPSSFLGQLVTTLKDGKADDALIESVMALGVAMSPPNSVLERLASRKEVAGYVRDPFWAFQEGTMGLGRKLINMEYGAKLNNEKNNMRETRKNIGDDPTAASIMEEIEKRAKYAANPSQSWWSNWATTATYGWTLGFNVSSAIVDMSSLALVTGPYLTRTYGWVKTHRAMKNAAKDIMGMGTSSNVETLVTQGLEGAELQEVLKTLGTKERDMVNRKTLPSMLNIDFNDPAQQQKYGYLKPLVDKIREAGHSERYSEVSESAEFGESNLLSKWAARMGFMMNASERFKREIGLKSAYDLALAKVGANPTPEQMVDAAQKAMEMSLLLNGGSTAVTGAGFQQNDIARIAFMYRRFAALQLYLQTKTAYDATLNDDPVVKAAARKFAAYTMLTSAAFVGVKGMPMMGAVAGLWAMYGALFGEEDEDNSLDNFLRTNLDPILVEGIPNILFNANVAGRMEMTNLLIRDSNLPNDATLADIIMAHFGGPAYGSASRAIRGAQLIADGEIQRGVENMLPVSVSNLFKSGRFLTEGAIETMRGDTVVEVNPFGALAQGLGFAPADYARAMDFNIGQSNAERRIYEKRTGLYEAVYTAYRVGDTGGVAQAMQAIIEFNRRYPEFAITSQGLKQSISGRDRNTQQMVMGRLPSERTRGVTLENAEDWGF
jgi:hypothetical protein